MIAIGAVAGAAAAGGVAALASPDAPAPRSAPGGTTAARRQYPRWPSRRRGRSGASRR